MPIEPTPEMMAAAWDHTPPNMDDMTDGDFGMAYKDMIAASLTQQAQERDEKTPEELGYVALSEDTQSVYIDGFGCVPLDWKAYQAGIAQQAQEQPQAQDVDSDWRRLALQFDEHRMQAIWHLQAMLRDPQEHALEATKFLAAGPLSGEEVLAQRIAAIAALPAKQLSDEEILAISDKCKPGGESNPYYDPWEESHLLSFARAIERALKGGK